MVTLHLKNMGEDQQPKNMDQENRKAKKLPQYVAALSACLGAVAAGAVLGWTANIAEDMKLSTFNGIEIDDDSLGWIGSFAALGAMTACYPIGKLCDLLGRKLGMLLLTIPFIIGWVLIICANSLTMIYIGRFLTGMSGGAFCVSAPIYTSEIAEKEIRGALGSYYGFLLCVGILVANVLAMCLDMLPYTIVLAVLPLIFAVVFLFQPESPVHLIRHNKDDKAVAALVQLRGKSYDVLAEIREIKTYLEEEQLNNISLTESIKKKATQKAAMVCFALMFFQQACGINAVIFYTGTIFEASGSKLDPKLSTVIIGVIQALANFVSSSIVDRLGRRFLLIGSIITVTISLALLGTFFTLEERDLVDPDTISTLGFLPITSLSLYVVMFAFGMGPIPWMISAELFPPEVKSLATGLAASMNWLIAFLVTKFFLNVKTAVGGDVPFYLFAALGLVGTVFIFKLVPETKGKSLNEIQIELSGKLNR